MPDDTRERAIGVLLFDSFSNHCLANAIEPLRAVNTLSGRDCYRWRFLSLDGGPVRSSSGMEVRTREMSSRDESGDYLFVLPSYHFERHATVRCQRALRAASPRYAGLVGMDTGSWLLASAGLLSGRRATIHQTEQVAMAECFPDVRVVEDRVVTDGGFSSCGGATAAFDLILDLIERHHGAMMRLDVAGLFLFVDSSAAGPASALRPAQLPEAAVGLMREHLEHPLSSQDIAARLGLSRKTLERVCVDRFGLTPRRLYLSIRLREAKRLVIQTGFSVAEVALRSGYLDASAMTRAFRSEFGLTPRAMRQARDAQELRPRI